MLKKYGFTRKRMNIIIRYPLKTQLDDDNFWNATHYFDRRADIISKKKTSIKRYDDIM